jgi:AraC-like DNA-binding protein
VNTCPLAFYRMKNDPKRIWQHHDFHSHNEYEIYLFHGGDCNYVINNKVYHLEPGDVILMNGLTLHRANPLPSKIYERSVVHFSPEIINSVLKTLQFQELLYPFDKFNNNLFRHIDKPLLTKIEHLIGKIHLLFSGRDVRTFDTKDITLNNRYYEAQMKSLIIELLFLIYELSQTKKHELTYIESDKEQHVRRITDWIEKNYNEEVTLDSIAEHLNVSKYYISHIFKEVTGGTVMKYLMGCRVNRAKRLLETEPEKSVLEVGLESGFRHSSHFSRFFLEKVGMTPSNYRKEFCCRKQFYSSKDQTMYLNQ